MTKFGRLRGDTAAAPASECFIPPSLRSIACDSGAINVNTCIMYLLTYPGGRACVVTAGHGVCAMCKPSSTIL